MYVKKLNQIYPLGQCILRSQWVEKIKLFKQKEELSSNSMNRGGTRDIEKQTANKLVCFCYF